MNCALASSELLHFTERGSGSPLLLVHGLMVSGEMFDPVIEHFATRHRVIVPDLRGHGRSRGLPPPYAAAQLASDLSHLLDHLGIDSTAVLGYSQGGPIAQQLVLDYPKQCDRLVLVCTYAFNMATFREKLEGRLVPLLIGVLGMTRFATLVISQGLKQVSKERADWVVGLIADQDRNLMVTAWKQAMAFDSRRHLVEIKCPTLIVAAPNDQAVPIHHAKMLHDGIAGSQLIIIDGADHSLDFINKSLENRGRTGAAHRSAEAAWIDQIETWLDRRRGTGIGRDDLLDVCACALAARDSVQRIPSGNPPLARGLRMEMWY